MYKYSATTGGFYVDGMHSDIPDDAVEISDSEHATLLVAQGAGAIIQPDDNGMPTAVIPALSLLAAQSAKRTAITAGFESAITASLTMPSATSPASAFAIYQAIEEWKTDDPDGFDTLLAIHTARRDELLASVDAATTVEGVQAIEVSYAV